LGWAPRQGMVGPQLRGQRPVARHPAAGLPRGLGGDYWYHPDPSHPGVGTSLRVRRDDGRRLAVRALRLASGQLPREAPRWSCASSSRPAQDRPPSLPPPPLWWSRTWSYMAHEPKPRPGPLPHRRSPSMYLILLTLVRHRLLHDGQEGVGIIKLEVSRERTSHNTKPPEP